MNVIEKNDIKDRVPPSLVYDADVVYSELPEIDDKEFVYRLDYIGSLRRDCGLNTYYLVPKTMQGFEKANRRIETLLCTDKIIKEYDLVQYGFTYLDVPNSKVLLNNLKVIYESVGDPCAGAGRSAEGFKKVYLYDKDEKMVEILKQKFN